MKFIKFGLAVLALAAVSYAAPFQEEQVETQRNKESLLELLLQGKQQQAMEQGGVGDIFGGVANSLVPLASSLLNLIPIEEQLQKQQTVE